MSPEEAKDIAKEISDSITWCRKHPMYSKFENGVFYFSSYVNCNNLTIGWKPGNYETFRVGQAITVDFSDIGFLPEVVFAEFNSGIMGVPGGDKVTYQKNNPDGAEWIHQKL